VQPEGYSLDQLELYYGAERGLQMRPALILKRAVVHRVSRSGATWGTVVERGHCDPGDRGRLGENGRLLSGGSPDYSTASCAPFWLSATHFPFTIEAPAAAPVRMLELRTGALQALINPRDARRPR
jgi:hypothetical protein